MTSLWMTLMTLLLAGCATSLSAASEELDLELPAHSSLESNYDLADDSDVQAGPYKRGRSYGFGLGKRQRSYGFGLGKRARSYGFGLGKRESYGFGLGKRQPSYSFGLGKRTPSYNFGLGKRSTYGFGLGKRQTYGFGLGKRTWGSWFDGPSRDVLKRPSYSFGLGKRSVSQGAERGEAQRSEVARLILSAAEQLAEESPASHALFSAPEKAQSEEAPAEGGDEEAAPGLRVRYADHL
ncbi:allatostatin-A-like [Pollicipes pollicipes]|uniref:allatostatin-A-like n=1 Tax=Pollicipes pollicipes TaxID=41117 RepID=UPI0018850B84|nr:allatostatin-A-like [Pollicipes pollicipes]